MNYSGSFDRTTAFISFAGHKCSLQIIFSALCDQTRACLVLIQQYACKHIKKNLLYFVAMMDFKASMKVVNEKCNIY